MGRFLELHAVVGPAQGAAPGPFHAGDPATLTLHATIEGDGEPRWPTREELQQALGQQAVVVADGVEAKPADPLGLGRAAARSWNVQLLLPPGDATLGPVPLVLAGADGTELEKGEVPAATVHVETVLEPGLASRLDQQQAAQDLKAEVTKQLAAPRGPWALQARWPLATMLVAALALALLAFVVWRLLKRERPVPPPPPPEPAEVVARRRLAALESSGLLGRGQHLAFHVELSDVLKQYLSSRLEADVTELTTDEVRRMLKGEILPQAARALGATPRPAEARAEILRVLEACDVVKFAKHAPQPSASLDLLQAAHRVVDWTAPTLPALDAIPKSPGGPRASAEAAHVATTAAAGPT